MKDKIMTLIIGILTGAVISTGMFYIYTTASNKCDCANSNMGMNGTPPEKPDGNPPEMPNDNNQNNNTQESN